MTAGLLAVLSEPGAVSAEDFHAWYDDEHVPLRMRLDGIHTGRRLRAIDAQAPGWLALYDLDLEVLERPEYRVLREQRSPREQGVVTRLTTLERRVYELCAEFGSAVPDAAVVVATSLEVPQDHEDELVAWYEQEHVPMLHAIPGWDRTRRFRLLDGDAPRWLALHELSEAEALTTQTYRDATSTSWRDRVMAAATKRERRIWTTYREFEAAPERP